MDAIKLYYIFKGVPVKLKKNDKVRVRVKSIDRCPFELYCGKMKNEDAIKLYYIFKGVPIKLKKNDKVRVRVKCTDRCPFELYCGKMKNEDTWIVKKLNPEHNCGR